MPWKAARQPTAAHFLRHISADCVLFALAVNRGVVMVLASDRLMGYVWFYRVGSDA
jgi:hypothetical protein